jgi:hypothetical protein
MHAEVIRGITVRPLRNGETEVVQAVFDRLGARSRLLRFNGAKNVLTRSDLELLARVDGDHHVLVAYQGGEPVGIARLARDGDSAEVAFAVVDDLQGKGSARSSPTAWPPTAARPASRASGQRFAPTTRRPCGWSRGCRRLSAASIGSCLRVRPRPGRAGRAGRSRRHRSRRRRRGGTPSGSRRSARPRCSRRSRAGGWCARRPGWRARQAERAAHHERGVGDP